MFLESVSMDIDNIREDFPSLQQEFNGKPVIYFDNACMTLRPRQVIGAMNVYYEKYPGCAGRSIHKFGNLVTENYDNARERISKFINVKREDEIVFTRNTTEGINLVANSLGLKEGDVVITSDREHNSNLLPWQILKEKKGIEHIIIKSEEDETFDMEAFKELIDDVKLVSMVHSSNIDGYTLPVEEIIRISHDAGALVMLDAAQSVPHNPIDVRELDVDFLAFSGHKMCGPSGTGILYGKYGLLEKMSPFIVGGDTVARTTYESYEMLEPPEKFEAGLQNYAGAMGMAAAAEYLENIGLERIHEHEKRLASQIRDQLSEMDNVKILGVRNNETTGGVVSFSVDGINHHDVAMLMDQTSNIMMRSGQHCAHSWFDGRGIEGSARVSLYFYNTEEEVETFLTQLREIVKLR
jgi:cysteine desulfurase/selenocysteine lyase